MTYRVVVLGGFGHFGARIVRALAATAQLQVIAAGRHPGDVAARWPDVAPGRISCCRLDIDANDFAAQLAATAADAVVHTAGPFQGQDYAVAHTCLQAGMHYIDLADGRAFVRDFPAAVDAVAKQAQRVAISGASTLPALSSAVIDALLPRFSALHDIRMVIAPAQGTPLGLATVRAVLSYCGTPFAWLHDGRWQTVVGWARPTRVQFAQLAPRLASPCDVPDHDLLPPRYPGVRSVQFRAALEVPFLQRCLAVIAWLRHHGMPLPMARLADVFARAARWFDRFGTDLGGMRVEPAWHKPSPDRRSPAAAIAVGPHRCDAARPGDSLLRRNPAGAQACRRAGVTDRRACLHGLVDPGRIRAGVCSVADGDRGVGRACVRTRRARPLQTHASSHCAQHLTPVRHNQRARA